MAPTRDEGEAPSYLDDIHQDLWEFADRHPDLWDDDDQRQEWKEWALDRKGYQRSTVTSWAAPEPASGSGGGGRPAGMPRGKPAQQGKTGSRGGYFGGKSR